MNKLSTVITAAILIIILLITIGILNANKTDPFTELYFDNHNDLPTNISLNKTYEFSFTIHNIEHKAFDYQYAVYIDYNNKQRKIMGSSVSLNHDESISIPVTFQISEPFNQAELSVHVNNQKINFWVRQI